MKYLCISIAAVFFIFVLAPFLCHAAVFSEDNRELWRGAKEDLEQLVPVKAYPYQEIFKEASRIHNVPLPLLLAVARGESFFDPKAKNSVPCVGIMQIRWPITAKHLGIYRKEDLYDPETNIMAGARYLREMLDLHDGDVYLALAAYHHGPRNIYQNISRNRIPPKANWYTGYIYHHLTQLDLRKGDETLPADQLPSKEVVDMDKGGHVTLIAFEMAFRVKGYMRTIEQQVPGLELEYFKQHRAGNWKYDIVIIYDNARDLKNMVEKYIQAYRSTPIHAVKRLFEFGFRPEEIHGLNKSTAKNILQKYF